MRSCGTGCGRRSRSGGREAASPPRSRPLRQQPCAIAPPPRAAAPDDRSDGRLLRGPRPGIRRLVSAPRALRARADPRHRVARGARCRRALAGRAAHRRPDRRARRGHRLVVAAPRRQGRARAVRRGAGDARLSRASAWSRIVCGRTPCRATPGRSPRATRGRACSPASGCRTSSGSGWRDSSGWWRGGCSRAAAYALIDSLPDRRVGAADHPAPVDDRSVRRLDDGREFEIVKVYYRPEELAVALEAAGFRDVEVTTTGRFFVLATAVR